MSTEGTSLAGWIGALLDRLGTADAAALTRLRRVVGPHRARITLDAESVDVAFAGSRLDVVAADPERAVDGSGDTDRATVLDLLDAHCEVSDAILDGRLRVRGAIDAVARMFGAIEILLDAAPRAPALQELAADFRRQAAPAPRPHPVAGAPQRHTAWFPDERPAREDALLARHDLLPDR